MRGMGAFVGGDALIAPHSLRRYQVSRADEGIGPYVLHFFTQQMILSCMHNIM